MAGDLNNGRERADACKVELRALIEKWAGDGMDSIDVTSALVETAADASLLLCGPDVALEMFAQVMRSIENFSASGGQA